MSAVNFRLLLVTDRHQTHGRPLHTILPQAIVGGINAIQIRERDMPTRGLTALVQDIRAASRPHSVQLIVNDRIDVVLPLNLAGVHLRVDSLPTMVGRRLLGPHRLVGRSTHSLADVRQANEEGADYVIFGPIFDTPSKRSFGPPLGLDALAAACDASDIPVFAIGGVTRDRIADVRERGAWGVAAIGAILSRDDVAGAAREMCEEIEKYKTRVPEPSP
jgi:thiamine-phosphate pyrophosphorylase